MWGAMEKAMEISILLGEGSKANTVEISFATRSRWFREGNHWSCQVGVWVNCFG